MSLKVIVNVICVRCSNLELYKEFAEEAYSVALHPSGLYVVVGFSDKLRLMNLLIDDIRTFREFPVRGAREVNTDYHSSFGLYLFFYDLKNNLIVVKTCKVRRNTCRSQSSRCNQQS